MQQRLLILTGYTLTLPTHMLQNSWMEQPRRKTGPKGILTDS